MQVIVLFKLQVLDRTSYMYLNGTKTIFVRETVIDVYSSRRTRKAMVWTSIGDS